MGVVGLYKILAAATQSAQGRLDLQRIKSSLMEPCDG